jgi:hypothetical protein
VRAALESALRRRLPDQDVSVSPSLTVRVDGHPVAIVFVDGEGNFVEVEMDGLLSFAVETWARSGARDIAPLIADGIVSRYVQGLV